MSTNNTTVVFVDKVTDGPPVVTTLVSTDVPGEFEGFLDMGGNHSIPLQSLLIMKPELLCPFRNLGLWIEKLVKKTEMYPQIVEIRS
jgi:hypothetical protein